MLRDYAHSENIVLLGVVFPVYLGKTEVEQGGSKKGTKCIRISLKKIDSNKNSQLIGVRRLYSEFITNREKCSPLIVNSLISIVKEM